ncbi:hypothetical protein BDW62DRAFT_15771 [Aspergillus aurantiobrunneus]
MSYCVIGQSHCFRMQPLDQSRDNSWVVGGPLTLSRVTSASLGLVHGPAYEKGQLGTIRPILRSRRWTYFQTIQLLLPAKLASYTQSHHDLSSPSAWSILRTSFFKFFFSKSYWTMVPRMVQTTNTDRISSQGRLSGVAKVPTLNGSTDYGLMWTEIVPSFAGSAIQSLSTRTMISQPQSSHKNMMQLTRKFRNTRQWICFRSIVPPESQPLSQPPRSSSPSTRLPIQNSASLWDRF